MWGSSLLQQGGPHLLKRGLVERAEDWKWSSFRHYATGEECGVEIESGWTARKRERSGKAPHLAAEEQ